MKTIRLFLAVFALLMTNTLSAQINYVPNGGFELPTYIDGTQPQEWIFNSGSNETESWSCGATSTYENPTGVVPAEGVQMEYIKCLKVASYAWQTIKKPEANCVIIKNGNNYIFKFKAYSVLGAGNTATPTIQAYVEEKGNSWTSIDKTVYNVVPGSWNSYSVSFSFLDSSIPTGTDVNVSLGFVLTGNAINTVFFMDDIQMIAGSTTSVNETKTSSVSLYPNPVINRCKILNGNFKTAKIFNLTGMLVADCKVDTNNEIDFSSLPTGCYMVKINGATEEVFKVVKK